MKMNLRILFGRRQAWRIFNFARERKFWRRLKILKKWIKL